MRRRALAMTASAVTVAVLLLGIPGILLGIRFYWQSASVDLRTDAARLVAAVDRRIDSGQGLPKELIDESIRAGQVTKFVDVTYGGTHLRLGQRPDDPITFSLEGSTGAVVTVEGSRQEVTNDILVFVGLSLLAVLVSFSVAVMVARWQSRRISAPLIYLAAAAEQIGAGQASPRMRTSGIEEIDLVFEELVRTAERTAGRIAAERQFAADASHQLRTPLTALSMRLEEIEYLSDQEEVREEAASCLEQVERLTGVVSDLLAASRAAGAASEAVSLNKVFDQQRDEWRKVYAKAGRALVFHDEAGLAVLCAPGPLSQIVATLIENSLKYGAGTTSVTSRKVGKGVVIEVADEGNGVADELREAIFTKGVSTGGSTGIGLPLARDLAESAGGRLELVQAQPAVFRVVLNAVPKTINPEKILPAGSIISMGSRRRRR